jgi:hypothetical protein
MPAFICSACGTQYPPGKTPPAHCLLCEEERQFIPPEGQSWTTLERLRVSHLNAFRQYEPGIIGIGTQPKFAIGQRALLVQTPRGNVLWDCISLIDDETVAAVRAAGGIDAIAISHPHYYSSMVEWSRAFDNAPIYLHAADRQWVMRPDDAVVFWEGETHPLMDGLTLIRGGGHFAGGAMLHWPAGADGRGALLSGDIIQVVQDRRYVSFMRSYPNLIPLPASAVRHVVQAVEPFAYDRIYGAWWETIIPNNARAGVHYSADRDVRAITE